MKKSASQIADEVLRKISTYSSDSTSTAGAYTPPPVSKVPGVIPPKSDMSNIFGKNAPKPIPESPINLARPIDKNPYEIPSPATADKANPLKRTQNLMPKNQIAKPVPMKPMTPKSQTLNTGSNT